MKFPLNEYCKEVKELLTCPAKDVKRCMEDIRESVGLIRSEHPEMTMEEAVLLLDAPEETAQAFLESLDPARVERFCRRKRLMKRLLLCAVAVLMVSSLYGVFWAMLNPPGTYITEIYTYETEDPEPDDPRPLISYEENTLGEKLENMFTDIYINAFGFFSDIADDLRRMVYNIFG